MHIIQEEIGPPRITASPVSGKDDTHILFVITPLPPGYGMTLGNAMRRVLLSSLPGAAVTSVRIAGVSHEYTTVKGVFESVLDITLNFKKLHLRKYHKEPEVVRLEGKGPGVLTAKDLQVSSDIEVLNGDLELVHLEKGGSIAMDITVEKGVGYSPASDRNRLASEPGLIYVDAIFTPVTRVRYDVQATRVGERTNLDRLELEVQTNGSLMAREAVQFASQLLTDYFTHFALGEERVEQDFVADFGRATAQQGDDGQVVLKDTYTPIEILNFSPRTLNALINGGIGSIEQLTKCSKATLSNLRGFGQKALEEVVSTLAERNLSLSPDPLEG
jgi:DNA-directed RNA polymerase subunit alpha